MNFFLKLRLYWRRVRYAKLSAPPIITYRRSYWYKDRWEIMCNDVDGRKAAIPTICGWCNQLVPAYPLRIDGSGGTGCHECGRTVDEYYRDWIYRAEYSDGCVTTIYQNGSVGSGGPKHAPHVAFRPNDIPIYEFITPKFLEAFRDFDVEKLHVFFRAHIQNRYSEWQEGHWATEIIQNLPEKEIPHQEEIEPVDESWKDEPFDISLLDTSENFSGNCFTANLIPKRNPTRGNVRRTSFMADNREKALKIVNENLKEDGESLGFNPDEYDLIISNGAPLQWAK